MTNTTNLYLWNQTLKFSWGHIIAFVALIFMSYVMYMGEFYRNGGDFTGAALVVGVIDLILIGVFMGAQVVKGTDNKFRRNIIVERILLILCPIFFVLAMIPYNHFWNVFSDREEIESNFSTAISGARGIFDDYDFYSDQRIESYSQVLDILYRGDSTRVDFPYSNPGTLKSNYLRTLQLQLNSSNTSALKAQALAWIEDANQDASVWNAFLVGNIDQISNAVSEWNNTLRTFSTPVLSNERGEGNNVNPFQSASYNEVLQNIGSLREIYTRKGGLNPTTLWTGIILFGMLLLPYLLQSRNIKAQAFYSVVPTSPEKKSKPQEMMPGSNDPFSGTF